MIGLGIDAVDMDRFRLALKRTPRLASRMFTQDELKYAMGFVDPVPRLAARFAAKEAVMKALGVGLGSFSFHDVEVLTLATGAPAVSLRGGAARVAGSRGVSEWRISLTHTAHLAEALVAAL